MNQKLCKAIRKHTLMLTVGKPVCEYLEPRNYVTSIPGIDGNVRDFTYTGTIRLDPNCSRGLYRVMKKNFQYTMRNKNA